MKYLIALVVALALTSSASAQVIFGYDFARKEWYVAPASPPPPPAYYDYYYGPYYGPYYNPYRYRVYRDCDRHHHHHGHRHHHHRHDHRGHGHRHHGR